MRNIVDGLDAKDDTLGKKNNTALHWSLTSRLYEQKQWMTKKER